MSALTRTAVVGAASDLYAPHLTVSLRSVLARLDPSRPVHVLAVDGGLSSERAARMRSCLEAAHPLATVEVRAPDPAQIAGLPVSERYPAAVYLPLLAFDLLPEGIDRALCLDADVVATEDLGPLLDMELGHRALWAVRDTPGRPTSKTRATASSAPRLASIERLRASFPEAGICDRATYVNTGVMLVNVPVWRRERVSERAIDLLRAKPDACLWKNQDAINVVLAGRIGLLPNRWNNRLRGHDHAFPELAALRGAEGVLHFCGPRKPWRGWCIRDEVYHRELLASGWLPPLGAAAHMAAAPYRAVRGLYRVTRRKSALGKRLRAAIRAVTPQAPA